MIHGHLHVGRSKVDEKNSSILIRSCHIIDELIIDLLDTLVIKTFVYIDFYQFLWTTI